MKITTLSLLLAILITLGVSCKKSNEIERESGEIPNITYEVTNKLIGEARHTDSLIKLNLLRDKDPNYITRHPGDDRTYDRNYGSINGKPTEAYIKANKWCVTYRYDNYTKSGCGFILLWHNSKSIQLMNPREEVFYNKMFDQWNLVDGEELFKLLK